MPSDAPDPKLRTLRSSARAAAAKPGPSAPAPAAAQKKMRPKPTAAKKRKNGKMIKSAELVHTSDDEPIVESEDESIPTVVAKAGDSSPLPDVTPSPEKVVVARLPVPSPRSAPTPPAIAVLTPNHTSAPSTPRRCDTYVAPPNSSPLGNEPKAPNFPSSDPISPPNWFTRKADRTQSLPYGGSGSADSMPNAPSLDETALDDLAFNSSSDTKLKRAIIAEGGSPVQAKAAMHKELSRQVDVYSAPDAPARTAGKVVTNTIEFESRGGAETPPLKQIVPGNVFYDQNVNLEWHFRNFPEMYDAFGQPLSPECPWPQGGFDIGLAPLDRAHYNRIKVPPHVVDDLVVNHFRVLQGLEGQAYGEADITLDQYKSMHGLTRRERWAALLEMQQASKATKVVQSEPLKSNADAHAAPAGVPANGDFQHGDIHDIMDFDDGEPDEAVAAPPQEQSGSEGMADMDEAADDTNVELRRKAKGKGREIDMQEGPSNTKRGRPTIEDNARWEALGKDIKAQIEELATELDVNYATAIRKLGFSQQEVRHGHLANIHRMVTKHRLKMRDEDPWSAKQHTAAYQEWKTIHGDDPDAANALLAEHQEILAATVKPVKASDLQKRTSEIATQMGQMSNNYLMGYNIAVVGAVIHLGPEHASSLFSANLEQNVALVKGFEVDQQQWLLKAKSILMLQADKSKSEGQSVPSTLPAKSYWDTGNCPRDDFKRWTRWYLHDVTTQLIEPPPNKWEPKKWPATAIKHKLVLVGWGSSMGFMPDAWDGKVGGAMRLDQWKKLVESIPASWKDNKYATPIPDGQYGLGIITLNEFLHRFPEHTGKHPCIVNRRGNVLWFADEDKAGLKGKISPKSKGSKKRLGKSRKAVQTWSSDGMSNASDSDEPTAHRKRKRKRAYDTSGDEEMVLIEDGDLPLGQSKLAPPARRPVPARLRPSAPPPDHDQLMFARQDRPPIPTATRPTAPPPDHGIQPGYPSYPPPFPPHGYPPAPPYGQVGGYTNPAYPPPFYQQSYPPWQANPAPQPGTNWQAPPPQLSPEEMEHLMLLRARQAGGRV